MTIINYSAFASVKCIATVQGLDGGGVRMHCGYLVILTIME